MEPRSAGNRWVSKLWTFWVLILWTLPFLCNAQITNITLSITNFPTNGNDIVISGYPRTWSTNVTNITIQLPLTTMWAVVFSNSCTNGQTIQINSTNIWTATNTVTTPTNQFLAGTNSASSATNFFTAYTANPSPFTTIAFAPNTSNQVVVYSYFGVPLAVTNSPGVGSQPGGFASIVSTNDIGIQTTNLFLAYGIIYKVPSQMNIFAGPATNQIQFQSFPGTAFYITIPTNGWCSLITNNFTPTNEMAVVVPDGYSPISVLSTYQRLTEESGVIALLNDNQMTNIVYQTNQEWVQFLGTNFGAGLTNFITNLVYETSNTLYTNFTNINLTTSNNLYTNLYYNITNDVAIVGLANTNFTLYASNYLYTTFFPLLGAINPWQDSQHDVYLTNGGLDSPRVYALSNGAFYLNDSGGNTFLNNDNAGTTIILDKFGNQRVQVDATGVPGGTTTGGTILESFTGNVGLQVSGVNDGVLANCPISFNTHAGVGGSATCIGSISNWFDMEENVSSSPTVVDSITIPVSSLTNNGDTLIRYIAVTIASTHSGERIVVDFPGNGSSSEPVVDTGSGLFTPIQSGIAIITVTITRTGSASYVYDSELRSPVITGESDLLSGGTVTGINSGSGWSATCAFTITLTSSTTGDLQILTDRLLFSPSAYWTTAP